MLDFEFLINIPKSNIVQALFPPCGRGLSGNLFSLLSRHKFSPCRACKPAKRLCCFVLAAIWHSVIIFTHGNAHNFNGIADHVSGALFAFETFRHYPARQSPRALSLMSFKARSFAASSDKPSPIYFSTN